MLTQSKPQSTLGQALTFAMVSRAGNSWQIQYLSGPRAELIKGLFGSDTLPLPYTATLTLTQVAEKFAANTKGLISWVVEGEDILCTLE